MYIWSWSLVMGPWSVVFPLGPWSFDPSRSLVLGLRPGLPPKLAKLNLNLSLQGRFDSAIHYKLGETQLVVGWKPSSWLKSQ